MNDIWQGKQIFLRAVEMSDLEDYFCNDDFVIDSDATRAGDRSRFPLSKTMMEERVKSLAKASPYGDEFFLIIVDFENNPVGNINTHSANRINGTFEYGIGVKYEFRCNGYASEAIKLVLRYYFSELGFQKVETKVYAFNEESIRLHEKLGFILEGKLRRNHFAMGKYHDTFCFGMTKEEFEVNNPEYMEDDY